MNKKSIIIGSDHGGFELKNYILGLLGNEGYEVIDAGAYDDKPSDYPDIARVVAEAVRGGFASAGILICKTGTGMEMAANRFDGVRAAMLYSVVAAERAREHEDANVAVLGSETFSKAFNVKVLRAFLGTEFSKEARHKRRIKKLDSL